MPGYPLVAIRSFIQATRDSGYKSTSSAIAELVDNSFEARADSVQIFLSEGEDGKRIMVTDNGAGMPPQTMQLALQFGGSTRFNSRRGTGRYGMGLPNGSLSQARRVDVYSWTHPLKMWSCYLVDEISSGVLHSVPAPMKFKPNSSAEYPSSPSGTIVVLTKCDRLDYRTLRAQIKRLHVDLGRIFRQQLYDGKLLQINDEPVKSIDPLFLEKETTLSVQSLTGRRSSTTFRLLTAVFQESPCASPFYRLRSGIHFRMKRRIFKESPRVPVFR